MRTISEKTVEIPIGLNMDKNKSWTNPGLKNWSYKLFYGIIHKESIRFRATKKEQLYKR